MVLPPVLAVQVELVRTQLAATDVAPTGLLDYVDAAALSICEHAEVDVPLLNRVMALRAAAERLAQARGDMTAGVEELEAAAQRAWDELAALEAVLVAARPSAVCVARGLGW